MDKLEPESDNGTSNAPLKKPSQKSYRWYQSVAAKLLFAFGGISILTLCACMVAFIRFNDASAVVDRLINVNLPAVKLSLTLENKAAEVSRTVAQLALAENEADQKRIRDAVTTQFTAFKDSLQQLNATLGQTDSLQRLADLSTQMDQEINGLASTVRQKIARASSRRASIASVATTTNQLISLLSPAGDSVIARIGQAGAEDETDNDDRRAIIKMNLPTLQAIYDIRTDIVGVENVLNLASSAETPADLGNLNNQFNDLDRRLLTNLNVVSNDPNMDSARSGELLTTVNNILAAGMDVDNIFYVRVQELNADGLLQSRQVEMQHLSDNLNNEVAGIVTASQDSATRNNGLLASEISSSRFVLFSIGLVSVILSVLVGWLFVFRYVASRMTDLAQSMLAVADGNLDARIPPVTQDELGDMSSALVVFRNNAKEIVEAKDIAEKARYEAESASRTKSAFLANMSHELRTPLNAIIGYSEMLLEDATADGNTESAADLKKIETAGKHLLHLINEVLDLSKIEAGRMDIFIENISIPALVEEVRSLATPLAANNQNELVVNVEPNLNEFRTDVTKLKQSLLNLVSNACKFTKGGKVTVSASRHTGAEGDELHIAIADTGIGMSEEQIGKLFQPFVQADNSTTRQFGGTGLGLMITRQFCRMLNGDVTVTSVPGQGSEFKIVLPFEEAESVPAIEALTEQNAGMGAKSLLLVDDDKQMHDLLGAMLAREGYRVLHASNGREAVARARHERPAAILLDIMMPQIDGWMVLRDLKDDPALCAIPVIIVSMLDERPLGLSLGAAEFLTKPVERGKLVATIERFVGSATGLALIVEDQEADRALLRHSLETIGMQVAEVENGRAALDWLAENALPATVILDIMMPGLDGFAVLDAIRKDVRLRNLPVIVLTAKELTTEEREYLRGHGGVVVAKGPNARESVLGVLRTATTVDA